MSKSILRHCVITNKYFIAPCRSYNIISKTMKIERNGACERSATMPAIHTHNPKKHRNFISLSCWSVVYIIWCNLIFIATIFFCGDFIYFHRHSTCGALSFVYCCCLFVFFLVCVAVSTVSRVFICGFSLCLLSNETLFINVCERNITMEMHIKHLLMCTWVKWLMEEKSYARERERELYAHWDDTTNKITLDNLDQIHSHHSQCESVSMCIWVGVQQQQQQGANQLRRAIWTRWPS